MSKQLIIVGVGRAGRALVKVMPEDWSIVAIDVDETRVNALPETHGGRPLVRIVGDAGNPLILEQAGIDEHSSLVIATRSDKQNIEIAKVARSRGPERPARAQSSSFHPSTSKASRVVLTGA